MGQFSVREYCEEDEDDLIAIHDLARPVELQGSCDPRAFVPLRDDAKDLNEFRACGNWLQLVMAKFAALLALAILKLVGYTCGQIRAAWVSVDDCSVAQWH